MDITDKLQKNVTLTPYTTFHIGGPADEFVIVNSCNELIEAVQYATKHNLTFFLLGLGANILIGDKGFRGLVIKNEAKKVSYQSSVVGYQHPVNQVSVDQLETDRLIPGGRVAENRKQKTDNCVLITAESGVTIEELITWTAELGLSGLEHFAGIPSTLGGALWQNLHFLSSDRTKTIFIGDIVEEAEIVRIKSQESRIKGIETVGKEYFKFDYDYSILHDTHDIVLSATLMLEKKDTDEILKTKESNLAWRREKHPENAAKKSAGSVFKKIEGYGAGRLIEQVGLKGMQIGGARISEKHANFIINTGNATAKDVRDLLQLVQEKVKERFGLSLEKEISFVGEF